MSNQCGFIWTERNREQCVLPANHDLHGWVAHEHEDDIAVALQFSADEHILECNFFHGELQVTTKFENGSVMTYKIPSAIALRKLVNEA